MPVEMPFGKYKGQTLDTIPDDYLVWCFGIAQPWLQSHIVREMRERDRFELLSIPCWYCVEFAAGWCARCHRAACFIHIRQVGAQTAYCIDHWDHWQVLDERVKMPPEAAVQWADEHPDAAAEYFAKRKKLAERRAARRAAIDAIDPEAAL